MNAAKELQATLMRVFPQRKVENIRDNCFCNECAALRAGLNGISWNEVPATFVEQNDDVLPMLTPEAYTAFLPAWLWQGILKPDGPNAQMLLVNLRTGQRTFGFTPEQALAIIDIANYMVRVSTYGIEDPVNHESLVEIGKVWSPLAAQPGIQADRP